ncbi:MAG: hypothetical protein JWN86_696 [Planctomycetota bacterium]|nr:hypothetical protein [Planctomycetota bacterium]
MMKRTALIIAAIVACVGVQSESRADYLGSAGSYAVLGGSTVTNTGPSILEGDLGVSQGTSITGFPPGTVTGTIHANDAAAILANADASAAYVVLANLTGAVGLTGQNLGGLTLTPGVYHFNSSAQLTGTLTLDAQGQASPLFVFQIGSTLTTASASSILMINGTDVSNVYFQVGSSATLGVATEFVGTIIASESDTLTTGANVNGRVIALNGAVTLDSNHIFLRPVPEPSALISFGLGGLGLLGYGLCRGKTAKT